jgi:tetratricopeptide (TPR) repeat protein
MPDNALAARLARPDLYKIGPQPGGRPPVRLASPSRSTGTERFFLNKLFWTNAPMLLAEGISILSLLQLLDESHASQDATFAGPGNSVDRLLAANRELARTVLTKAAHHAWMSVEIALAGPRLWDDIVESIPVTEPILFRQRIASLLDLIRMAVHGLDKSDSAYGLELQSARQANILAHEISIAQTLDAAAAAPYDTGEADQPQSGEWYDLNQIAAELNKASYPHLAGLTVARMPWNKPLLLGVVGFFVRDLCRGEPVFEEQLPESGRDVHWRCLNTLPALLDNHHEALVTLLDNPEPSAAKLPNTPDDQAVEKLRQCGLNHLMHGDYAQAVIDFTAALKIDPTNGALYAHRGDAYRYLCEYERAIANFHVSLQLNPAAPSVLVGRAIAYHRCGEFDRAIVDCSAALKLDPTVLDAYRTRAAAYLALGAHDLALLDLTEAIAQAPDDETTLFQRAEIYVAKRNFGRAISVFTQVVKINPHHVQAYLQRGHAYLGQKEYAQAAGDFSEVLRRHSSNVVALGGRGRAYQLLGDSDRALGDYTEALRLDANSPLVYYRRGILYRTRGDHERAKADLDEALRLEPENLAARYYRGKIFLAQGRFAQALSDLDEVLHLQPKLLVGYLSRALVHDRLGQSIEAEADSTQAIKLSSQSPAAYFVRGLVYARAANYAPAIADLTKAIALDSQFALAFHERSMAYTLKGDYDQALADCNQLIALEPRNAQSYASRSVVFHYKGDVQQALIDYARALQIDPKCIMLGWNQNLAEAGRNQCTQRISDYIEGLRPEPQGGEGPPTTEFVIILEANKANGTPAATATPVQAKSIRTPKQNGSPASTDLETPVVARIKSAGNDTATHATTVTAESPSLEDKEAVSPPTESAADNTMPDRAKSAPPVQVKKHVKAPHKVLAGRNSDRPRPEQVAEQKQADESDAKASPAEQADQTTDSAALTVATEQVIDTTIDELLADSSDSNQPAGETATPAPIPTHPVAKSVECSNCHKRAIPAETLPGGQYRCGSCNSVFTPAVVKDATTAALAALMRSRARNTGKKINAEDREPATLQRWLKPISMTVGSVAAIVLLYFFFPMHLLGKLDRVPVFPVQGKIEYEGKPIPNATIFLHPVGEQAAGIPRPRGIVKEDGSFVLGTYDRDDGIPAGAYKVSVQWFKKAELKDQESGRLQRNLLPTRYAAAETSGLALQIKEGENQIPVLKLKR